jgi:hypothetical protein
LSETSKVFLWDRVGKQLMEATLFDKLDPARVIAAVNSWQPLIDERVAILIQQNVPRKDWPQHAHWDWNRKVRAVSGLLAYQFLGIECKGEMQGLMLTGTVGHVCRISSQAEKPLLTVHFLASAPWNLPDFADDPRFGLVGKTFVAAAIQLSLDNGFHGRIGLHSLPQAESFYLDDCGMTDLGIDAGPGRESLRYFEMTPNQANIFLRGVNQ